MLIKYPRTHHIEGSRLQPGDEDLQFVPLSEILSHDLVIEEKLDGANAGVSFASSGEMLLQSRGHYLTGGSRERQFDLFKKWANSHKSRLWSLLGDRYILYGEWMYAKHTIFYDSLPHYFVEFDVLDRFKGSFLSTGRRRQIFSDSPVTSVAVMDQGRLSAKRLHQLVGPSQYKSKNWRDNLAEAAIARGLDPERASRETDPDDAMEGLYIKVEDERRVKARYKYIRPSFRAAETGGLWQNRTILPNQLAKGVDIFKV